MQNFFRHAAVALDLSEASDLIVRCISSFQKTGTEKITLITVIPVPQEKKGTEIDTSSEQEKLDQYREILEEKGFDVDIHIRTGVHYYPPVEILAAAEEMKADFVVLSNRGRNKVFELLAGSTATEVLQRSALPVYLINLEVEEHKEKGERTLSLPHSCEDNFRHILYVTDFSESSSRALTALRKMDEAGLVDKISMIHVQGHHAIAIKDPASRERLTEQNREQLDSIRNSFSENIRENMDMIITFGTPVKEILDASKENDATMIMMGSQGEVNIQELFMGGVSSKVTRLSQVPVLLIPAKGEE